MPEPRPRARKEGASAVTPDDLKEWIDAVPPGVAVTLPNGVTIDKRIVLPSTYYYPGFQPNPVPAGPTNGYQCPQCWKWVNPGQSHSCTSIVAL